MLCLYDIIFTTEQTQYIVEFGTMLKTMQKVAPVSTLFYLKYELSAAMAREAGEKEHCNSVH